MMKVLSSTAVPLFSAHVYRGQTVAHFSYSWSVVNLSPT